MKRLMVGLAACLVAVVLASPVDAQITGSAHDFNDGDAWNTSGELCIVCHTPHNADPLVAGSPLWNHEVTATALFTLYTSLTLENPMSQPTGQSLLCLSCHDGTVALDNFGGTTVLPTTIGDVNIDALVGIDLSNDHPVSFSYDAAYATDGELVDPTDAAVEPLLFGTQLECASCHDVHNNGPPAAASLLRVDNVGSALCFTCHIK